MACSTHARYVALLNTGLVLTVPPRRVSETRTRLLADGQGSGFSKTPLTTLKIVLVTPVPSAIISTETRANPG